MIFRRRAFRWLCLCLALCALSALPAQAAPACGGVDLVARLKRMDARGYAAFRAEAARVPAGEGLLWRIEKPGVAPSHLFGTFHAGDARLIAVAARTDPLVKAASAVATELGDMSQGAKRLALAASVFAGLKDGGEGLGVVEGEAKRATLARLAQARGLDRAALERMAPWMLVGLFALPACEFALAGREVVDDRVMTIAREAGVAIEALESVEEQLDALKSIDPKLIGEYLGVVAERPDLIEDGFATMVGLYAASRIGAAEAALKHALKLTARQSLLNGDVAKRLVADRNRTMARRAGPLLEKGRAFIAVGALHLVGEQGMVELLRKDGWSATKVW